MSDQERNPVSLQQLGAAPHRLLFFVGASNVLLAMVWWTAWLASQTFGWALPQPGVYAGWLHAFVMQYQMLPSFIFGFLLTVFPRWMQLPELPRARYLPVGIGLFGGQLLTLVGALGWKSGIAAGWALTCLGWLAGLHALIPHLWREPGRTWHARSCALALCLGVAGLAAFGGFLGGAPPIWMQASAQIGTFGLLTPIYLTVAHRMFPFFAGNVVAGYIPWRPFWVLGAMWVLCLGHLAIALISGYRWLWLVDIPLLGLTALLVWRWWPRAKDGAQVPALLRVLFIGLLWLPVTFTLYAIQSVGYYMDGVVLLGRAPAHALFVGFFGSVLVAMVTRVTQGHSGRPLVLPRIATFAFVSIQGVALLRIAAEFHAGYAMQALAGLGWVLALAPWAVWAGRTYLAPRADGKPG
ncbi:NnrS family protein [Flagellatimonas centrodinii]|uniref:NnrS family protein n=1 Tax=Flagellatimonas centrodinii TaxID=2806210 RepID=UPI001FEFF3F9|nr:NnrS family protein [Flagellatimonas centrodinii]ULQ47784.1 NnrS family protein [Flagellatimonas centrodinii]